MTNCENCGEDLPDETEKSSQQVLVVSRLHDPEKKGFCDMVCLAQWSAEEAVREG